MTVEQTKPHRLTAAVDRWGEVAFQVECPYVLGEKTYARDPHFYGATYCVGCGRHLRVGAGGEFVWDGTDERVGT